MPNPLEEEQEQARLDEEAEQEDALDAADRLDPVQEQRRGLRYDSAMNEAVGQDLSRDEQERIHALENAQRREAAAAAAAAQIRQQRGNNPEAAEWDRAAQIPRPGGRRHRKTRKHSRKHTKKNRKVSRRKMTRRRR